MLIVNLLECVRRAALECEERTWPLDYSILVVALCAYLIWICKQRLEIGKHLIEIFIAPLFVSFHCFVFTLSLY